MRNFKLSYQQYQFISTVVGGVVLIIALLFIYVFFAMIYRIIDGKEYTTFSYALLAANAVICSILLAFGRSPVFIERHKGKGEQLVYFAALMFMYAAIISFIISGWAYVNTDKSFHSASWLGKKLSNAKFIAISFTIGIGIAITFSLGGVIYFFRWTRLAIKQFSRDMDKENIASIRDFKDKS